MKLMLNCIRARIPIQVGQKKIVLFRNFPFQISGAFHPRSFLLHQSSSSLQKPGICADCWFLESNGKMVQLGFSLAQIPGFWDPMVKWCNWDFLRSFFKHVRIASCWVHPMLSVNPDCEFAFSLGSEGLTSDRLEPEGNRVRCIEPCCLNAPSRSCFLE